jgi:hypothetical protein
MTDLRNTKEKIGRIDSGQADLTLCYPRHNGNLHPPKKKKTNGSDPDILNYEIRNV